MTDQSTETEIKGDIFTPNKEEETVNDQKTTSDQEVKTSTEEKAPDLEAVFNERLKNIVDDKGEQKYKDVFTALEALNHSQRYIKTLEDENKQYKETRVEQDTLEQALQNISAKDNRPEPTKSEGLNAEQIKQMVSSTLMEEKTKETKNINKNHVSEALVQKFGDVEKAKKAYSDKAAELGVDVDMLADLASVSPKAVLAYFDTPKETFSTSRGSINPQALGTKPQETVDYAARFYKSSDPSISKWKEAGEGLK